MRQLSFRHRRHAVWAARGALIAAAAALVAARPRAAAAQLAYNATTFVHGFGNTPAIWQRGYPDLGGLSTPGYLAQQVVLGGVRTPDLDANAAFDPEVANLAYSAASTRDTSVFVGYSLGGLATRRFYLNYPGQRQNVAAIVAVTAPHQGAILADSALRIQSFFFDVQRRVNEAGNAVVHEAGSISALVGEIIGLRGGGTATGVFLGLGAVLTYASVPPGLQLNVVNGFSGILNAPALADLKTTSPIVQQLNQNTADAAVPRANVVGSIPFENAAFRLGAALVNPNDEEGTFHNYVFKKNFGLAVFHTCRVAGYVTIINWGNGRACGFAVRVLDRIDDQWARATNGTDTYRHCVLFFCSTDSRGRRVPFDGVVPNERSKYPGLTDPNAQFLAPGASHANVIQRQFGVNKIARAMLFVHMRQPGAPQWTPVGGYLANVSVGADGATWGVNSNNQIFRWNGSNWDQIGGYLKQVAVGSASQVWGVNASDQIFYWSGNGWTPVEGLLKQVAVGSDGTVWGVNESDQIFRWNGSGWNQMPGYLDQVSVGVDGTVWGVNSGHQIFRWNSGGWWDSIAGALQEVSVGSAGRVWGVDTSDQIFQMTGG